MKKFHTALDDSTSDLPADPKNLSTTPAEEEKEKKRIELNDIAVASYTMVFTTATLMKYIENSKTTNYPDGRADAITARLLKNIIQRITQSTHK